MKLPDGTYRHRRKSIDAPGHIHELTFSCHARAPYLLNPDARVWFVKALKGVRMKHRCDLLAFVIMPEHVHVLIKPQEPDYKISKVLTALKLPVARRAAAHGRADAASPYSSLAQSARSDGRVEFRFWERGGGYDRNLTSVRALMNAIDYIHMNPVRRGLAERPEEWYWSSAAYLAGLSEKPVRVDRLVSLA